MSKRYVWIRGTVLSAHIKEQEGGGTKKKKLGKAKPETLDPEFGWGWTLAVHISETKDTLTLAIEDEDCPRCDNETLEIPTKLVKEGDMVPGGLQVDEATGLPPDNLINMTHLHEPAVVYGLRKRFFADEIYTATGPILLAVNPFKRIEGTYSDERMDEYWDMGVLQEKTGDEDTTLGPHVFRNADRAFRNMMKVLNEQKLSSKGKKSKKAPTGPSGDQSLLVSGESGAGKTVTTKFIMKYLATVSERIARGKPTPTKKKNKSTMRSSLMRKSAIRKSGNVEQKIVQSNPILESFGNARTHRNDNSSRFGKFIELRFSDTGTMIGAAINTYLLEKIRLISQSKGERNYHIFYELLAGANPEDRESFHFDDYEPEDFKMTSRGETFDRRDGVEDEDTFDDLIEAFETLGFNADEETKILSVTAALLHAGNLTFKDIGSDESKLDEENEHLDAVVDLLGVEKEAFNDALCYFYSMVGKEKYKRNNNVTKAAGGLEALIKATFNTIFEYLVERVNDLINSDKERAKLQAAYIGVLDIFGFESFEVNSFEQLCINYCNEALQQQFNKFVFKNEQDEYTKEGIKWDFISFPDNSDSLDLIDKKGEGILSLLDSACQTPSGSDKTFGASVYKTCPKNKKFSASPTQQGRSKFTLMHYAGPVEYYLDGFVEKNKDELPKESQELLNSSKHEFVKVLAARLIPPADASSGGGGGRGGKKKKPLSVGGQFTLQLKQLREKIDSTSPHYVRCLKPNDKLIADDYNPLSISGQLRCAGVIEAVRVSRVGYPQRYPHDNFMKRYGILNKASWEKEKKLDKQCVALIAVLDKHIDGGAQMGKSKVFMRAEAFDVLEKMRVETMEKSTIVIQAVARGFLAKRYLKKSIRSIIIVQSLARGGAAREIVAEWRRKRAATKMAASYRRYKAKKTYASVIYFARWCQRTQRGKAGRKRYDELNRIRKAIAIQKVFRTYYYHKRYVAKRKMARAMQCVVRCFIARKVLKKLKLEAKDLGNVKQERDKLKVEVESLRAEVGAWRQQAEANGKGGAKAAKAAAEASAAAAAKSAAMAQQLEDLKESQEKAIQEANQYKNELKKLQESAAAAAAAGGAAAAVVAATPDAAVAPVGSATNAAQSAEIEKLKKELAEARQSSPSATAAAAAAATTTTATMSNPEQLAEIENLKKELEKANGTIKQLNKTKRKSSTKRSSFFSRKVEPEVDLEQEAEIENLKKELETTKEELKKMEEKVQNDIVKQMSPDEKAEFIATTAKVADVPSAEQTAEIEKLKESEMKANQQVEQLKLEMEELKKKYKSEKAGLKAELKVSERASMILMSMKTDATNNAVASAFVGDSSDEEETTTKAATATDDDDVGTLKKTLETTQNEAQELKSQLRKAKNAVMVAIETAATANSIQSKEIEKLKEAENKTHEEMESYKLELERIKAILKTNPQHQSALLMDEDSVEQNGVANDGCVEVQIAKEPRKSKGNPAEDDDDDKEEEEEDWVDPCEEKSNRSFLVRVISKGLCM